MHSTYRFALSIARFRHGQALAAAALAALLLVSADKAHADVKPISAAIGSCEGATHEITRRADDEANVIPEGRRKVYCIRQSNVKVDCNDHKLNGLPWWRGPDEEPLPSDDPGSKPAPYAFRIIGNVHNVEIKNCTLEGYRRGVEVGFRNWDARKADEGRLLAAFRAGQGATIIEDDIRTRQPRDIKLVSVDVNGMGNGDIGVYVFPYSTAVTYSDGAISDVNLGIYLDSGTQRNVITHSHFKTREGGREAIAIDASADNTIVNNVFSTPSGGGVFIYKNCGEDLFPRFQWARGNRIRANTFSGIEHGVLIGARADKIYQNRKADERFDDKVVVDDKEVFSRDLAPYSWYCADRPYFVPRGEDEVAKDRPWTVYRNWSVDMSWLAPDRELPSFLDSYHTYAFYRDRAPDNVVRCNEFNHVDTPIIVADDHAFIQKNDLHWSGPILVGSAVRSKKNDPVRNVNVVGNLAVRPPLFPDRVAWPTIVSEATGTVVSTDAGRASEWGESEACND